MKKKDLIFVLNYLKDNFYSVDTQLNYSTDFQLLIAVILSAQSTDKQVNKITKDLFEIIKVPNDIINLGLNNFTKKISSINYFKTKAKSIFKTAQILLNNPELLSKNLDDLQKLPGVGMKTAKVVSHVLRGEKVIAVDTHVQRVVNRLGIVKSKDAKKTSEILEKKIPEIYKDIAHHSLIYFGRYHCKARKPMCEQCGLKNLCDYYKKNESMEMVKGNDNKIS